MRALVTNDPDVSNLATVVLFEELPNFLLVGLVMQSGDKYSAVLAL